MSDTTVTRDKHRVTCTITFTPEQKAVAEEKAVKSLGASIDLPGFRKGTAPAEVLKEKINPDQLGEETVRNLLPDAVPAAVEENNITPIIPPRVTIKSEDPLTIELIFTERPAVKLKGVDKIKIEKKNTKVEEKDIDQMIDYLLSQHQTVVEVDRAAKKDDKVTASFWGDDEDGNEIPGTRLQNREVVIGSKTLIPGFEDGLIGLKKGDTKDLKLTFPEKYHAEDLAGKPVTFHVTVDKVEEVQKPELSESFIKQTFGQESEEAFRKEVEKTLAEQEERVLRQQNETQFFEAFEKAVTVDLGEDLVNEEVKYMFEDLSHRLEQQQSSIEQWLQSVGKKPEEVLEDFKKQATSRLTVRFGLQQYIEDKQIDVSPEEVRATIDGTILSSIPADQQDDALSYYQKGGEGYEQIRWQKLVEKVMEEFLG